MKLPIGFMILAIICGVIRFYADRRIIWLRSLYVEVNRPLADDFDLDAKMWSRVSSAAFWLGLTFLVFAIISVILLLPLIAQLTSSKGHGYTS